MRVKVTLHGYLRGTSTRTDMVPSSGAAASVLVAVPTGTCKVEDLLLYLGIPKNQVGFVTCNGLASPVSSQVADGDEIGIFPVLTGG